MAAVCTQHSCFRVGTKGQTIFTAENTATAQMSFNRPQINCRAPKLGSCGVLAAAREPRHEKFV